MKRTPLQRKTPLKPGKARLKAKSTKQRKFRDVDLQQHYRDQNEVCELTPWLKRYFPSACNVNDYSLDLHHINAGHGKRYDLWTNFIRVSRTVHDWIPMAFPEGTILCLWKKLTKNELDLSEWKTCNGMHLEGWLSVNQPTTPAFYPLWEELLAYAEMRDGSSDENCVH